MSGRKRRSAGEGHVRYNAKLGVWEARAYIPPHLRALHGGKREKPFYAKKEKDATAKRDAFRETMARPKADDLSFGEYLKTWLDGPLKGRVAERTYQDREYHATRHLIPPEKIGAIPLASLSPQDLDALYAKLSAGGMGPRGVNHVHETARVALQAAVKKGLVPYNPARDAEPPRYSTEGREYRLMDDAALARFFAAVEGDRYEALFVAGVLAGFRPNELRALMREDLTLPGDPEGDGAAHVWRGAVELKGQAPKVVNRTKTGKRRYVPLLPEVVASLKVHLERQEAEREAYGDAFNDAGLVFPTTTGTVVSKGNLSRRHFKPAISKAGLPMDTRLYDLRHSFATLWVGDGGDMKLLQLVLGHARYETTANRYVHPSDKAVSEAMRRFGKRRK